MPERYGLGATVALTYGINPNLLHNWIALYRKEGNGATSHGAQLYRLRQSPGLANGSPPPTF